METVAIICIYLISCYFFSQLYGRYIHNKFEINRTLLKKRLFEKLGAPLYYAFFCMQTVFFPIVFLFDFILDSFLTFYGGKEHIERVQNSYIKIFGEDIINKN